MEGSGFDMDSVRVCHVDTILTILTMFRLPAKIRFSAYSDFFPDGFLKVWTAKKKNTIFTNLVQTTFGGGL